MRQNYRLKIISISVFFLIIFLFSAEKVFAQVVINEFSSNSSPEWVEIYNTSPDQTVDLFGWQIIDGNGVSDDITLSGCILPLSFRLFNHADGWLNNGGDTISLKNSGNELVGESVVYGTFGMVAIPLAGKSAGRDPNGGSSWQVFDSPSPVNNDCQFASPTPTSTLTPTPTTNPPTPTSAPTATYKINEVKDNDGEVLSSVKVYVDGVYVHHYAPEVLTFCDGCQCDTYVACGLGQHTIKLEKTGYNDWNETKTINSGDFDDISPVMVFSEPNSTTTPTLTISLTTPTQKISPTPTPKKSNQTATDSGEILGEEVASFSAFYPYEATDETKENEATSEAKNMILPKIFLVGGLLLLFISASWLWYNFVRNE
jgi:hypothetical protein